MAIVVVVVVVVVVVEVVEAAVGSVELQGVRPTVTSVELQRGQMYNEVTGS